jgi:hypothetical protein
LTCCAFASYFEERERYQDDAPSISQQKGTRWKYSPLSEEPPELRLETERMCVWLLMMRE